MAQVRQDNVQIKLEIDGQQSKTELDNLTRKAQVLQQGLKEMKRGTDEYIAANKELRQVNTRIGELRDEIGLTGLNITQLGKFSKQLARELNGLTPETEAFVAKSRELAEVEARLTQVRTQARGVQQELEQAGGGFGEFVKKAIGFAGIQLGVEAVLGGLKELGTESVAEFEQAQGAAAQLQAALTSTGGAAGLTKQELLDLSTALEGKTILDGDAITQAQSVLLTFTKIKKGVYEEALPAIVDMATRLGGDGPADLQGATIQVGKALNDPIKGITALAKAGVSFSEDQKAMIKSLVETGDVAGAQAIILGELKNEFGGSAEAAAKAGTGPLKQFEIQVGNVKEGLGELIVDGLQALQPVLSAGLQLFAFFIEALKATPAFLVENRGLLAGLAVALLTLNVRNIATTASTLALNAVERGRAIATTASAVAQRLLNAAMSANPIGLVITAVALLVGGFITLYEKSEKVREVVAGLGRAAVQVFTNIKQVVLAQLSSVGELLAGIFTFDPEKIRKGLAGLGDSFRQAGKGVAEAYHAGYAAQEREEQAAAAERERQARAEQVQQTKKAATEAATASKAADLEALKDREANLKAALALVAAGSAEELRLKKLEVATKRDIDLLGESKTAGDKKVIRAEALRDLHKLQEDYDQKTAAAAEKRAKEQAEIEKKIGDLQAGLLRDETEKRIRQLTVAAEQEKATAKGTAEQIAEQRKLIDQKLAVDVAAERQKQADKQLQSDLGVEKLRNSLIKDEFDRKDAEIITAHKEALSKLNQDDKNYAAQVIALEGIKNNALAENDLKRVAAHRALLEALAAVDRGEQLDQAQRAKQQGALFSKTREEGAAKERDLLKADLQARFDAEIASTNLTDDQKRLLKNQLDADMRKIDQDYLDWSKMNDDQKTQYAIEQAGVLIQTIADFQKIASDKELAKLDKEKKARLAKLEAEYKAGTVSKEAYEARKSDIEANYDQRTRELKKRAAEKEKELNVAQSIIAGILAVLKAGGIFSVVGALTAVSAAAATAKIIATPIPEFEQGGLFGRAKRHFARGGKINATAGVADVGQRHSSGGIRMVDGATGEHLGEWERGEAYMILSRQTYANNKYLIDELLDTSLHRGGAPVRPRPGYFEDGGTFTAGRPPAASPSTAPADSQELVKLLRETRDAIRELPSRQYVGWDQQDTAELEQRLDERQNDRQRGQVR